MKRVGIYGGSFDPIHNGHLITIRDVIEQRKLETVFLIPTYISPFKMDSKATNENHRIEMLKLASNELAELEISTYEIERKGVSYTIDTLKYFKSKFDEIELIIGYDNIVDFDKWKYPDEIFGIAEVVVMKRNVDSEISENKYMSKATYIDTPNIDISSTDIRERVKNNMPINFLVPDSVKDYILKNKLYTE